MTDPEADNVSAALAEMLEGARQASGMSERQLATRTGLNNKTVGRILRGEQDVKVSDFVKIARALDLIPGELFDKVMALPEQVEADTRARKRFELRAKLRALDDPQAAWNDAADAAEMEVLKRASEGA